MKKNRALVAVPDVTIPASVPFANKALSPATRTVYTQAVRQYGAYCNLHRMQLGMDSLRAWLDTHATAKTYNLYFLAAKSFLTEFFKDEPPARRQELADNLKSIKMKRVNNKVTDEYLTHAEVKALIAASSPGMALIIEALFWSGCRVSELIGIQVKKCHVGNSGEVSASIIGKGQKERNIFLPESLFRKIQAHFHGKGFLFCAASGKPLHRNNVSGYIWRVGKRVLNKSISAHTLRHSKAMYLKDVMKLSPDQIAQALGHASVVTTLEHYFHGTPSAAQQGIGK